MIKNVTIGSDSELIIADRTNRPFPVCGILGGTKDKPRKLGATPYTIQEDNVLLEFNIPPCTTEKEFSTHMRDAMQRSLQELPPSLHLYPSATAVFDKNLIGFAQAHMFGCDPDFNAWIMEENPKPCAENKELRSAAGHVHIGWENPTNEDRINLIKAADIFVGLRSVLEFSDRNRRQLYGKAGSFRPKSYGVEHRVLDNEWVWQRRAKDVYYWYMDAINFVNVGLASTITEVDSVAIQKAINEYEVENSKKLLDKWITAMAAKGIWVTTPDTARKQLSDYKLEDFIAWSTPVVTVAAHTGNNTMADDGQ